MYPEFVTDRYSSAVHSENLFGAQITTSPLIIDSIAFCYPRAGLHESSRCHAHRITTIATLPKSRLLFSRFAREDLRARLYAIKI